ncbi:MAG: tetratricopeptide repeat protein [Alistipes sp.]|nr:tetratricopeptide repeat protein [Alistipes sp.]
MRVVFVALLLSIINYQLSIAQSRDSLIVHYTDGIRLAADERYTEALGAFEKALAADPDHAPSLYEAAILLMAPAADQNNPDPNAEQNADRALAYSSRAVELDPDNAWYRRQKARILISRDRFDEALTLYEAMVADEGAKDPDNYRMLALLYYRKDRTDDALAALDSAMVRTGPDPGLTEMKRGMLLDADRVDEAAAVTEAYIASTPYDEENRLALASIYGYQGRDSLQVATLDEVIRINPDNDKALSSLADLYFSQGRTALHIATLKQLFTLPGVPLARKIERLEILTANTNLYRTHFFEVGNLVLALFTLYPGNAQAAELYSDHLVRGGDTEGALALLKGRLEKPEPPLSTLLKTIQIEAWVGRADSVAHWGDAALELYPREMEIYLLLSGAQQYLGQSRQARKTLSRALRVADTDSLRSEVQGTIGTLWHEEGNVKKTYAAYDRALEYNAGNALVLNNYAYFLSLEGRDLDRALGMARRATRLEENSATYLDTYAWVLYKTGDYTEARRVMQLALPLDSGQNPELLMHYGDILWALGEQFMATTYWKRARDAGWEPASEIEERLSRIDN